MLDQGAILEPDNPHHATGEIEIVRGDQGADPLLADETDKFLVNLFGGARIEISGRLVGQEQERLVGKRAGDGDTLALAARKFRRAMGQACLRDPDATAAPLARLAAAARGVPAISCGMITFSMALNSGSR